MKLQGNTRLELLRDGKVVHRVEKHNVISPWLQKAIREGDFGAGIDRNKIMPLTQWFSGCILTDKANCKSNTDPGFFGMINQDSNVIAMAGDDAYTGTNTRRGSADLSAGATGPITNGYRWTWNWSESFGNGDINSVCLTRAELGKLHFVETGDLDYETDPTLAKTYINESLTFALVSGKFLANYGNIPCKTRNVVHFLYAIIILVAIPKPFRKKEKKHTQMC